LLNKLFLFFIVILFFTGCGYKPSSYAIATVFDDAIFVEVEVSGAEPENAPFVKDELNRMIYLRFKGRVASKEEAKNYIKVRYEGSDFTPLAYKDGYITHYRINVRVYFDMLTKEGKSTKTITAFVDRDIQSSSLTFSTLRTQAIKIGLEKALDEFFAYVSVISMSNKS